MAEAKDIERVKLLTGETNEELIEAYLEEASDFVKGYTNRSEIITPLEKAVRDLAVIALNRMGIRRRDFQKRRRGKLFI